jgi:hypothetical protein
LRVESKLPERAVRPSGESATDWTSRKCPMKVRSSLPVRQIPELERLVEAAGQDSAAVSRGCD